MYLLILAKGVSYKSSIQSRDVFGWDYETEIHGMGKLEPNRAQVKSL
jgi:hypothetical protein